MFLQPPHYPEPVYSHLKGLPAMLQMPSDMWCLPDYNRFVPDYTVHSDLRAAAGTAEESPSCMYKVRPDIYSGFSPVSLPLPGLLPELPAAVPEPELLPVRMPELPLHAVPLLLPLKSVISETRHKLFYPLFSSQAPEHSFWHPSASYTNRNEKPLRHGFRRATSPGRGGPKRRSPVPGWASASLTA